MWKVQTTQHNAQAYAVQTKLHAPTMPSNLRQVCPSNVELNHVIGGRHQAITGSRNVRSANPEPDIGCRSIPDIRRHHQSSTEMLKADLRFRRKRSFASEAKISEPVIQRRQSVFELGRQQCSDGRSRCAYVSPNGLLQKVCNPVESPPFKYLCNDFGGVGLLWCPLSPTHCLCFP